MRGGPRSFSRAEARMSVTQVGNGSIATQRWPSDAMISEYTPQFEPTSTKRPGPPFVALWSEAIRTAVRTSSSSNRSVLRGWQCCERMLMRQSDDSRPPGSAAAVMFSTTNGTTFALDFRKELDFRKSYRVRERLGDGRSAAAAQPEKMTFFT